MSVPLARAPRLIHVRRLNAVTRWMQRNPQRIVLKSIKGPFRVVALSDSAFKKEDESGHAMRGCVVMLVPKHGTLEQDIKRGDVHLIDYASRKQRHVTRSTFAAELLAAADAFDQLW